MGRRKRPPSQPALRRPFLPLLRKDTAMCAVIPGTMLTYGPEGDPPPDPDELEQARREAAEAYEEAETAIERYRELAERAADADGEAIAPDLPPEREAPPKAEESESERHAREGLEAQRRREELAAQTRAATITTHMTGGDRHLPGGDLEGVGKAVAAADKAADKAARKTERVKPVERGADDA